MNVRRATLMDFPWLKDSLRHFREGHPSHKDFFADDEFTSRYLCDMVENQVVFIAEKDGNPVGLISGVITGHPYNPGIIVLFETHWWVDPDHRGSRAGGLLLRAFVEWGRENVDRISLTLQEGSNVKHEALTKRGFQLMEHSFHMEVA